MRICIFINTQNIDIMEITFEKLESLIKDVTINGNMINVNFQAPNQDQPMQGVGVVAISQEEMMKNMKTSIAKTAATNAAISGAGRALGSLIGGAAGSMVGSAASSAGSAMASASMQKNMLGGDPTEEQKKEAIIQAFQPYITMYTYDEATNTWSYNF